MRGKPITRRTVLSRRDALTDDARVAASRAIAEAADRLLADLAPGSMVALYAGKGTEVDTTELDMRLRARGLRVVYPRIVEGERRLSFHEVTPDALVRGRFGLREPADAEVAAVELSAIAAFVIPGVAFDQRGGRVGWGRGYYDATLAAVPGARRIGLGFECQLVDEVPRDAHDVQLHAVVTESTIYRGETA
jgi:5-formyltetrahydrofolate cyclo-ligase